MMEVLPIESSSSYFQQNFGTLVRRKSSMIFSILGNSETFTPKPWPRTVFQAAIIDSARNAGESIILYQKGDFEVSDIIEEACLEYESALECATEKASIQLFDRKSDQREVERFFNEKTSTFFVTEVKNDGEKKGFKMRMPVLLVVLEGDIDTVRDVAQATKNGLPVLLVRGTGKAADLIANFLDDESTLTMEVSDSFGPLFPRSVYEELQKSLLQIKERAILVNIFDVESDDPAKMSALAGDVIVKAWSLTGMSSSDENDEARLNPTVSAGSNDDEIVTTQQIFAVENSHFTPSKYTCPKSLPLHFYYGFQFLQKQKLLSTDSAVNFLLSSLRMNRTDYVKILLNKGISLTLGQIARLYKQMACTCSDNVSDDIKQFQMFLCCGNASHCSHVSGILKEICSKFTNNMRKGWNGNVEGLREHAHMLCREILGYKKFTDTSRRCRKGCSKVADGDSLEMSYRKDKQETFSVLLLWALLFNKEEIAFIVWQETDNHLLSGLVCTAILRKLENEAERVKEHKLSKEFHDHAEIFQERCLALTDVLYATYPVLALKVMDNQQTVWSINTTPLQFANENMMLDVIAHPCAQKYLYYEWRGGNFTKSCLERVLKHPHELIKLLRRMIFIIHIIFFLSLLFEFSGLVLTGRTIVIPEELKGPEILGFPDEHNTEDEVYFWAIDDLIGKGLLHTRRRSHRKILKRLFGFLDNFWNILDIIFYLLLLSAVIVKYGSDYQEWARTLYSLTLLVMFIQFLYVFLMHRKLGPLLIMFKEMLRDLSTFLLIGLVLVVGVGVYYHANMWPNHVNILEGNIADWRIWDILYYPYWQIFGEGMHEFLEGRDDSDCTSNYTVWSTDTSANRCPVKDPLVPLVAALYMMISNLLLVNLVIAMFSDTYNNVKRNSKRLWRYETYNIITDDRGKITTPMNILFLLFIILRRLCIKCCTKICKIAFDIDIDDEISHSDEEDVNAAKESLTLQKIQKISAKKLPEVQERRNA